MIATSQGAALATTRLLATFLFGLSARDPLTVAAAVSALLISMAAGWLPARRAAMLDPVRAIKTE